MEFGGDTKRNDRRMRRLFGTPKPIGPPNYLDKFFEFRVGSGIDSLLPKPLQVIHDECQS